MPILIGLKFLIKENFKLFHLKFVIFEIQIKAHNQIKVSIKVTDNVKLFLAASQRETFDVHTNSSYHGFQICSVSSCIAFLIKLEICHRFVLEYLEREKKYD